MSIHTDPCPTCGQTRPPATDGAPTVPQISSADQDFYERLRQRARETDQPGRSPVITDRSPGVVYSNAIRRARELGYSV
jgi:hypothetical protein